MIEDLGASKQALVICDAGIATEQNIAWLIDNAYRYLVVSRERARQFDAEQAIGFASRGRRDDTGAEGGRSAAMAGRSICIAIVRAARKREEAIAGGFVERFDKALTGLAQGLAKPRGQSRYDKVLERIARLKQKSDATASASTTRSRSKPMNPARSPPQSPGTSSPNPAPCSPIRACSACAPMI